MNNVFIFDPIAEMRLPGNVFTKTLWIMAQFNIPNVIPLTKERYNTTMGSLHAHVWNALHMDTQNSFNSYPFAQTMAILQHPSTGSLPPLNPYYPQDPLADEILSLMNATFI